MRILVTRPQPAAARTAERLRAMGHEPLVISLMQGIADPEAARAALLEPYSALALTSAEAVRTLASIAESLGAHLDIPVFCVGTATENAARALGFRTIVTGPGTGDGLAKRIAKTMAGDANHRLLYLAGMPRSPDFEAGLRREAIDFRVVECYRMVPVDGTEQRLQSVLAETPPDVVLLYSGETAQRFLGLPSASAMTGLRYLCLSRAIAGILPDTISNVAVAATPDEDSLLRLL